MDSRTPDRASTPELTPTPEAVEFVRFCRHRRSVGWPELYDEMCAVAGRGLFRGWGADELNTHGIGFSLFDMPRLAELVRRVIGDEPDRMVVRPAAVRPAAVRPMPEPAIVDQGPVLSSTTPQEAAPIQGHVEGLAVARA